MKLHLILLVTMTSASVAQTTLWSESTQGDLGSDYLAPPRMTLVEGSNVLSATFHSTDRDLFTLTVPSGLVLDGIFVSSYTHPTNGNVSFLGMQVGSNLTKAPSNSFTDEIGYTLFGSWALDGTNLLPIITSYPTVGTPLVAGDYAFWLNETTTSAATTTLSFRTTAIPEPSCAGLLMIGALSLGLRRSRTIRRHSENHKTSPAPFATLPSFCHSK